jgi:hypothetical protein
MKSIGTAVLMVALVGGLIFLLNLLSGMARQTCSRNCPTDKTKLVTHFDFNFVKYEECKCK